MNFPKRVGYISSITLTIFITSSNLNAGTFKTYKEDSDQFRETLNQMMIAILIKNLSIIRVKKMVRYTYSNKLVFNKSIKTMKPV